MTMHQDALHRQQQLQQQLAFFTRQQEALSRQQQQQQQVAYYIMQQEERQWYQQRQIWIWSSWCMVGTVVPMGFVLCVWVSRGGTGT